MYEGRLSVQIVAWKYCMEQKSDIYNVNNSSEVKGKCFSKAIYLLWVIFKIAILFLYTEGERLNEI